MTLDKPMQIEYEEDFGFSVVGEAEITQNDERVEKLKSMFIPLLNNLLKNPEKEYIYWPNREQKIKEIIKKIQEI